MKEKYILAPQTIAKECYLIEALFWVAFKIYPFECRRRLNEDDFEIDRSGTDLLGLVNILTRITNTFTEENCNRFNLPFFSEDIFNSNVEPNSIEEVFDEFFNPKLTTPQLHLISEDADNAFRTGIKNWVVALAKKLDLAKSELFIHLRKGELQSHGVKLGEYQDSEEYIVEEINFEEILSKYASGTPICDGIVGWDSLQYYQIKITGIPEDFWSLEGIDWTLSRALSNAAGYFNILINTKELFALFPEPKPRKTIKIKSTNRTFIVDETELLANPSIVFSKKGRPILYDWEAIDKEMSKRETDNTLPESQKARIIDMQLWYKKKFVKKAPSIASFKNHMKNNKPKNKVKK